MKKFNYQFIGRKLGFAVNYASYEDDNGGYFSSSSEYLNLIRTLPNISAHESRI
jgi:hypothetical protein